MVSSHSPEVMCLRVSPISVRLMILTHGSSAGLFWGFESRSLDKARVSLTGGTP